MAAQTRAKWMRGSLYSGRITSFSRASRVIIFPNREISGRFQGLTKSLLPMPSQWYGLENEEEAMRKRYLDFVMNSEKKDLFFKSLI